MAHLHVKSPEKFAGSDGKIRFAGITAVIILTLQCGFNKQSLPGSDLEPVRWDRPDAGHVI